MPPLPPSQGFSLSTRLSGRARSESAGSELLARGGLLVAALLLSGFAGPVARGDVVYLKSGRTLEGRTEPGNKEGTLRIFKGDGAMEVVSQEDIQRIERKVSRSEDFEKRLANLRPGGLGPLLELLVEARDQRLVRGVEAVARRILEVDPNNEPAREALGYVVFENRWVLRSALRRRKGLTRFRGGWVTKAEKSRLLAVEMRKDLEVDLKAFRSENTYIRKVAARKIRRLLVAKDPAAWAVLAQQVSHPDEDFRTLALVVLSQASFEAGGASLTEAEARAVAADLHQLFLVEESPRLLELAGAAAATFYPRESFRLALDAVVGAPQERERRRAAEELYHSLQVAFVPRLLRALVGTDGSPREEVHAVVVRVLGDGGEFGYDVPTWLRYWEENKTRYRDPKSAR